MGDDAGARSKQVWKVLAPSRTSAALTKMFVNDDPNGDVVHMEDEEFLRVVEANGGEAVRKLDGGTVMNALAAWCKVFKIEFKKIEGWTKKTICFNN